MLKKVWEWIVYSSANPEKLSLTLKAIVPFLVLFGVKDETVFGGAIDSVVHLISMTGVWITGAVATYGALRKLFYTVFPPKQ